jgi:hypothetical protein
MPARQQKKKAVMLREVITKTIRKKQRSKPPRKKVRARGRIESRPIGPLTKMLAMSLANPFEYSGCIPDGARGVGCFSVKNEFILGTGAAGTCCGIAWNPNYGGQALYVLDTLSTAVTPTTPTNWSNANQIGTIDSLYAKARPISAGLRITYIGNTQTDGGLILGGLLSGGVSINSISGQALTNVAAFSKTYKIVPLRNGVEVIWLPDDEMDVANFSTFNSNNLACTQTFQAPLLIAWIFGAGASTASLAQVECVANFEGQYSNTTFMPGGLADNTPPAEGGWYENIMNFARSIEQVVPAIGQFAQTNTGKALGQMAMGNGYRYASRIASTALPMIGY